MFDYIDFLREKLKTAEGDDKEKISQSIAYLEFVFSNEEELKEEDIPMKEQFKEFLSEKNKESRT